MKKLAIITTHPIQYYAPVFKLLQQRNVIEIKVFYTLGNLSQHDHGFNKKIVWDIPLLDGYTYEWAENTSAKPGSNHFKGIITPHLTNRVLAWQPDAALFYGWAYDGHLNAIKKLAKKIPLYFRGDSTLLNEPTGVKKVTKYLFLKWLYKHFNHAFYVGTNNKAYFKKYGLKNYNLSFAPHAIDNERFYEPRTAEVNELRSSLQLTDNDILVLYAGKFEAVKNLSLLLKAFIALNRSNVHLLLAGNGAQEEELKQMAINSILPGNIHFTTFKNQLYMPVLYQAADLVCLPSVSETWGLAINEAMACQKAVLTSDKVGCAVDLVKPDINGDIFISGNEQSLVESLQKLTQSKNTLQQYGKASGEIISDWNFTKVAEAIENELT